MTVSRHLPALAAIVAITLSSCGGGKGEGEGQVAAASAGPGQLLDGSDGADWPAFGRTYGEQHFSPLRTINDSNIGELGLAWSMELGLGNSVTGPLAVGGILYFASGYSLVHAVDAASGKLLWKFDPKAPEASGQKLRQGWGSRGIAYWNGKIYTGTQDGRLIAVNAATGRQLWSQMTVGKDDARFISGPPRVFDGKVIIGHGGADVGSIRGYVTTYDAETGRQLWRFHVVPGNPADGFENEAMAMAAKTWAGEWWKHGGGGTVWNAMTYDAEFDTVYLGTGNGAPWNHKIRSAGKGDNLFLSSVVALDAKTGRYKWHYQINPGETWDYNASMDMELAELNIGGRPRKVLMTAPKNGFFYVLDRANGKLISAEPFVTVNWASKIDLVTGRPVEMPGVRYENKPTTIRPTPVGAHSWLPMSFSPQSGLVYIPAIDLVATFDDRGITPANWRRKEGLALDYAVNAGIATDPSTPTQSALVAWNPVTQKEAWRIPTPGHFNGGTMATAGNLVFQGQADSKFNAYDARTGKRLWSFAAGAPVVAPPITYTAGGRQYVTVLTGMGTSGAFFGPLLEQFGIDYRTQKRRVLTFAIGGTRQLPPRPVFVAKAVDDPDYRPNPALAEAGGGIYNTRCVVCHGGEAIAGGAAPDLRMSGAILSPEVFASIVQEGALVPSGMPRFEELTAQDQAALRQYVRDKAKALRDRKPVKPVSEAAR
jgi:quinohemoprotein ethanol dehydrogenase